MDIPVYIVTINKTESEDKVLFDAESKEFMPYSGRYVNLGQKTYLLCNNTRYENCRHSAFDGYPFPVKLKIDCPYYKGEIDGTTIKQLIDQVLSIQPNILEVSQAAEPASNHQISRDGS